MKRRTFLRIGLLSAIAAASGVIYKSTEPVGFGRWMTWLARGTVSRWFSPSPRVALFSCPSYNDDVAELVRQGWIDAQMPDVRGARVVIKPNLVEYSPERPLYTHPRIVQSLVQVLKERSAREIIVAEGVSFRRDSEAILHDTGYSSLLQSQEIPFVDLNYDDLVSVPTKGGYTSAKTILLPRTICEADLVVSVPKLKMHHWTLLSASIKNLFGTIPGIKYGWPKNTLHIRGIPAFLTELVHSFPTRLSAVVDGIVGMEGDGPLFGTAVPSGVLVFGSELLAVDATCARLVGLDPFKVNYLELASWAGLGTIERDKIILSGTPITNLAHNFALPPILQ